MKRSDKHQSGHSHSNCVMMDPRGSHKQENKALSSDAKGQSTENSTIWYMFYCMQVSTNCYVYQLIGDLHPVLQTKVFALLLPCYQCETYLHRLLYHDTQREIFTFPGEFANSFQC